MPYLLDRTTPQPIHPRRLTCPHAPEGEKAWVLRPRGFFDVAAAVERLARQPGVRCLLLEGGAQGDWIPATTADLRRWAAVAERRLERPVGVLTPGRCPCGAEALCRHHAKTRTREQGEALEALGTRQDSLADVFDRHFQPLRANERRFLQEWAHRSSKANPNRAITVVELARRYRITARHGYRILQRAEELAPEVMQAIRRQRSLRAVPNRAYQADRQIG